MAFRLRAVIGSTPFFSGTLAVATIVLATIAPRLAAQDSLLARLDTARISAAVRSEMQANGAPGASIAVVIGDRVVYRNAFGVRSAETQDPMTTATLVRLGSVTKSFTGLTASLMASEARIDLTAPIGRHAPRVHASLRGRTLHELLTHTAGFADEAARDGSHDDAALEARVLSWDATRLLHGASAGDIYSYASTGYWLAGYVLQRADSTPYADLVTRRLLKPLGMTSSTFRPLEALTRPLALDHRVSNGRADVMRPFQDDVSTWPSGSLFSSVDDMARYAIALLHDGRLDGQQVLPADAVRRMFVPEGRLPDSPCGYSYGLSVCDRGTHQTASHYGFRVGSGAVFTLVPSHDIAIIVLANRNGGIMGRSEAAVLRMLLGEPRATAAAASSTPAANAAAPARARFVGTWSNGGASLRVFVRNDSLFARVGESEMPARVKGAALELLDAGGNAAQEFELIPGARSRRDYLHDGLNALARAP